MPSSQTTPNLLIQSETHYRFPSTPLPTPFKFSSSSWPTHLGLPYALSPMLDAKYLTSVFLLWQIIYLLSTKLVHAFLSQPSIHRRFDSKSRSLFALQAPPYIVSTLHALYVFPRGYFHLTRLFRAPLIFKLVCPRPNQYIQPWEAPFAEEINRVMWSNLVLAGYLLADLCHVIWEFPTLGGYDTLLHHLAFLTCAVVAGWYRLHPFMFGWLILGEASTPLLNLRWFLIKAGYGSTRFFKVVEMSFALVFLANRFLLFTAGLLYQIPMLQHMPPYVPLWATSVSMGVVIVGYFLNLSWLRKIVRLAIGSDRRGLQPAVSSDSATAEAAKED